MGCFAKIRVNHWVIAWYSEDPGSLYEMRKYPLNTRRLPNSSAPGSSHQAIGVTFSQKLISAI